MCSVCSVIAACSYGKSCVLAPMQACVLMYVQTCKKKTRHQHTRKRFCLCLHVPVCVYVDGCTTGIQLVCPWCTQGSWHPEADNVSWQLSAPRQTVHYCGILETCSPQAPELTSGSHQSDKQAEQYNNNLCLLAIPYSEQMWKHLNHVFWCNFFSAAVPFATVLWHDQSYQKEECSSLRN